MDDSHYDSEQQCGGETTEKERYPYVLILGEKRVETDNIELAREFLGMISAKAMAVQIEAKPLVEATPTVTAEAKPEPVAGGPGKEKKEEKPKKKVSPRGERTYTDNGGGYTIITTGGGSTTISKKAIEITKQVINEIYADTKKPVKFKQMIRKINAVRKQSRTTTNRAIDVLVEVTHELEHIGRGVQSAYAPVGVTAPAPVNNEAVGMSSSVQITPNARGGFRVQSGKTDTSVSGAATDMVEKSVTAAYEDNNHKPVSPKEVSAAMQSSFQHRLTAQTIALALLVLRERGRITAFKVGKRSYVYVPAGATRAGREAAQRAEVPVVPAEDAKREEDITASIKEDKHTLIKSLDRP